MVVFRPSDKVVGEKINAFNSSLSLSVCLSLCDDIFSQQQDETTSHSSQVHHQETKNERSGDRDGDVVKDEENFLSKNGKKIECFSSLSREIAGVPYSHKKSIIYLLHAIPVIIGLLISRTMLCTW